MGPTHRAKHSSPVDTGKIGAPLRLLIPPSETKLDGGDGPSLDLDRLGFPELNDTRPQRDAVHLTHHARIRAVHGGAV